VKAEFEEYLKAVGMGDVLLERVAHLERSIGVVCPEEIKHIFVADYLQEDGIRGYEHLFFFSTNYAIQASNFVNRNEFDIDRIGKSIVNLKLDTKDFDFQVPTDKARLSVRYLTVGHLQAHLKASGENCAHLVTIIRDCLVPNFVSAVE
jgi:hypothetical protein